MSKYRKRFYTGKSISSQDKNIALPEYLNEVKENTSYGERSRNSDSSTNELKHPPDQYKIDLHDMRTALNYHLQGFTKDLKKNKLSLDSKYSTSVNWFPADTEELFYTNMKDKVTSGLMEKAGWCSKDKKPKDDLKYNVNKHGFRCINFRGKDPRPGILSLGCSFTFGVGLKNSQTFAQKVADNFDMENYNLGTPGRGLDLLAIYLSIFIEKEIDINLIKAIVVFLPPPGRETIFNYSYGFLKMTDAHFDVIANTKYYHDNFLDELKEIDDDILQKFGINDAIDSREKIRGMLEDGLYGHLHKFRSSLYEHNYFTQENNFKREILNVNSIKLFAMTHNIPLVIQQNKSFIENTSDFARDMMHPGPKTHHNIAQSIISKLNIHLT